MCEFFSHTHNSFSFPYFLLEKARIEGKNNIHSIDFSPLQLFFLLFVSTLWSYLGEKLFYFIFISRNQIFRSNYGFWIYFVYWSTISIWWLTLNKRKSLKMASKNFSYHNTNGKLLKIYLLRFSNLRKMENCNKPFQLLWMPLVNWLNPQSEKRNIHRFLPFLRDERIFICASSGRAWIFHRGKHETMRGGKNIEKTELKRILRVHGNWVEHLW